MSATAIYHLRRAALVAALVACASLLGAALVYAQEPGADLAVPPGLPGGQVTVIGALLSAILYLAKRLESRPTAETLSRAYTELDAAKAEVSRLRDALDAERVARLRAEFGPRPAASPLGGGAA